jgi:hypothetical protein
MMNEQMQAAKSALLRAGAPMSVGQIRAAIKDHVKVPGEKLFKQEMRKALSEEPDVHLWPEYRGSPLYWSRSVASCVEEALLTALGDEWLNVTRACKVVKKGLRYLSEKRVVEEVRELLPRLAASGKIVRLPVTRQSAIYLSRNWMTKQAHPGAAKDTLSALIPSVVARLQAAPGNYVRVDHLRHAPEICAVFDQAIIGLADADQLVLGAYDGRRPAPEEKWLYVADDRGELYIGVALPRRPSEGD